MPGFAAAVTCIDGRFHAPLVAWVQAEFEVDHVDLVTSPGVAAGLATDVPGLAAEIAHDLAPSLAAHHAAAVVIAAHEDCAADLCSPDRQRADLAVAVERLRHLVGDDRPVAAVHQRADGTVEPVTSPRLTPPLTPPRTGANT